VLNLLNKLKYLKEFSFETGGKLIFEKWNEGLFDESLILS
jgi:hypothetical protein